MSKVSSKSKVNMKIDALQRAEESYYKKKDKKQVNGFKLVWLIYSSFFLMQCVIFNK